LIVLSRFLFDRVNKVDEEDSVAFFLPFQKRYLDEYDFVKNVYC